MTFEQIVEKFKQLFIEMNNYNYIHNGTAMYKCVLDNKKIKYVRVNEWRLKEKITSKYETLFSACIGLLGQYCLEHGEDINEKYKEIETLYDKILAKEL